MSCYVSYKKKEILKMADYLLKQECCDNSSCDQLVDDLQEVQFKCNDVFKNAGRNSLDVDEKGNIEETACSQLRDKKNEILELFNNSKLRGGNKKNKKRTRNMQKYKKSKKSKKSSNKNKKRNITRKIR
jgi:hypothetical protein